jgi:prepilin-type N-terminal cleavage/methylation domain-containing protein
MPPGRRAFTLVELMVAITILVILSALAYLIVPQMMARQIASEGASQLQGWVIMAQQRAKRDQAPRGIRLNLSQGSNPQYVTDLQYIEQPDDYYFNGAQITNLTGTMVIFAGAGLDFYGGNGQAGPWLVQVGDYLLVNGGLPHQITQVGNPQTLPNGPAVSLTLLPSVITAAAGGMPIQPGSNVQIPVQSAANIPVGCWVDLDYNTATTEPVLVIAVDTAGNTITVAQVNNQHAAGGPIATAGIISKTPNPQWLVRRQPRVLAGEDTLQLPQDVAIDLSLSIPNYNQANQTYIDILFDRHGMVIGPMTSYDKVMLWVRDVAQPAPNPNNQAANDGDHTLVCIYCRTGGIASHPANFDPNEGDFYAFAREGRSSGE